MTWIELDWSKTRRSAEMFPQTPGAEEVQVFMPKYGFWPFLLKLYMKQNASNAQKMNDNFQQVFVRGFPVRQRGRLCLRARILKKSFKTWFGYSWANYHADGGKSRSPFSKTHKAIIYKWAHSKQAPNSSLLWTLKKVQRNKQMQTCLKFFLVELLRWKHNC